jgi:hypothetical protein
LRSNSPQRGRIAIDSARRLGYIRQPGKGFFLRTFVNIFTM